jgi:hypothetical protein
MLQKSTPKHQVLRRNHNPWLFSFVYGQPIKVVAAASAETPALAASEEKSIQAFRATFASIDPGDDDAIFERLTARHPFYNGEIYPKVSSSL